MYNLLNANFFRLRKNKIFWCIIGITLIIAIIFLKSRINTNNAGTTIGIDQVLLDYLNIIGITLAIFTSFFIGEEFTNGAIRNKITVGYSRTKIYISNLIISIVTGVIIELFYLIFVSIIGLPILGGLQMSISQFLVILLNIIMIIITYSCIFTFIALLSNDITISTVFSLIFVLIMIVVGSAVALTANSSEYLTNTVLNEEGKIVEVQTPNPNYPGIEKKQIAQTLLYIIPSGQATQIISYRDNTNHTVLVLYSLCVSTTITILGLYAFNKDNLK